MVSQPHWSDRQAIPVHINSFGAFLRYLRERERLEQRDLTTAFPVYFEEHRAKQFLLNADMYRKLEKGYRAAQYEELLPLYATLLGCGCKLSVQECHAFVRLARQKLESLRTRRPKPRPDGEWRMLESQLLQLARHTGAAEEPETPRLPERLRPRLLSFDISHLVGRETWLESLLSYFPVENRKKLVVISGMMGVGKTSGLKLLLSYFLEQHECYPLLYTFTSSSAEDLKPADHLQAFLATVLAEFGIGEPEATKMVALETQVKQVLIQLAQLEQRVVFLLDDAQHVLDGAGQLTPEWEQFLAAYLGAEHQAVIYLAAREWPLWLGRNRSFVRDGDDALLPALGTEACLTIWQRLGFTDVAEELLYRATEQCGSNPLMIELRAASLQRPRFSFGWEHRGSQSQKGRKNEHERLLEEMLEETHVFSAADNQARQFLQQVISQRLSRDALELLEMLSVPSIALPFPLLAEGHAQAEYAFSELQRSALLDREALANDRARLLPLVREAGLARMGATRHQEIERHLLHLYEIWLNAPDFLDDQEQSMVVTEALLLFLKHHCLLKASELFIAYGWLSFTFGHGSRLVKLAQQELQRSQQEVSTEEEIGRLLLHYYFAPLLGQKVNAEIRSQDARRVLDMVQAEGISLASRTQVRLLHFIVLQLMNNSEFEEAQILLQQRSEHLEALAHQEGNLEVIATLQAMHARLVGNWSDSLGEQGRLDEASRLREQAARILQECVIRIQELEANTPYWDMKQSSLKYRRARYLTNLGYHLGLLGRHSEALEVLDAGIELKAAGYAEQGSLAATLGEKAQMLMHLGRFQEALDFDQQARGELGRLVESGHTFAQDERWVYDVDRACLYLRLGRVEEAEKLLQEALRPGRIADRRREYRIKGQKAVEEIREWRAVSPSYQLDWRWSARYRDAINYDPFQWLSPAGPFSAAEQDEWEQLAEYTEREDRRLRRSSLLDNSKKRELEKALTEGREPLLLYPAIPIRDLGQRQTALVRLAAEIREQEPNALVRRLYLDAIEEQLCYLRMIQATSEGDGSTFFTCNRQLHAEPSKDEMTRAFVYLQQLIQRGLQRPDTSPLSTQLLERLKQLSVPIETYTQKVLEPQSRQKEVKPAGATENGLMISPEVVRRFFAAVLHTYGFAGWEVMLDPSATDPRIEPNIRSVILPTKPISVKRIRNLLSHEIESHVFRTVAGERSPLALLGSGTKGSLATDEGLAQYFDRETALVQGIQMDESDLGFWIGTLATGLASGVLTPPATFTQIFGISELVFALNRLLKGIDKDIASGRARVRELALARCLRTFRGVPDLCVAGYAYVKDAIYLRGYRAVTERVQHDESVLTRLMVGIVALEQLDDLKELGITAPPHPPRWLAHDPQIESFILSFQDEEGKTELF